MNIDNIRKINQAANIIVTMHGRQRMAERGVFLRDVMNAIEHGEIIEQYPAAYPFPACLILGASIDGRRLHAVVSLDAGLIYLITAYFPDPAEWEPDMKTRKDPES